MELDRTNTTGNSYCGYEGMVDEEVTNQPITILSINKCQAVLQVHILLTVVEVYK